MGISTTSLSLSLSSPLPPSPSLLIHPYTQNIQSIEPSNMKRYYITEFQCGPPNTTWERITETNRSSQVAALSDRSVTNNRSVTNEQRVMMSKG